jgi:tryptophan-rich sensory protein
MTETVAVGVPTRARPSPAISPWLGLLLWLALCVGGGVLSGLGSAGGDSTWYRQLERPSWTPPSWLFGPVWTALYTLMAVAAWRIWRRGGWAHNATALRLFLLQLAANFAWTPLFFTAHLMTVALLDLVALWIILVATIALFARRDRIAPWLLAPYLAWVTFAGALNAAFASLNGEL